MIEIKQTKYKQVKGDVLDAAIAQLLDDRAARGDPVKIPIVRLGKGQYLCGSSVKSIQLKGGYILVRVGGGFSPMDDFLTNNESVELSKLA